MATQQSRAEEFQASLRGLIVVMLRDLAKLWPRLNPHQLDRTIPRWANANHAVVARYAAMSSGMAGDFYDAERIFAKATGRFTVPLADAPPLGQVDTSLRWATKNLWDPPAGSDRRVEPLQARIVAAKQKSEAVAAKLVTDTARATIVDAVKQDRVATAWARQARSNACYFCRMLATRGPVYGEHTVGFQAHDGCSCVAVPLFKGQKWQPDPHVREWQALYEKAARSRGDTIHNFRKLIEGRA